MESQISYQTELDSMEYAVKGLLHEIKQKRDGGFFSHEYINEKLDTIKTYARLIKN